MALDNELVDAADKVVKSLKRNLPARLIREVTTYDLPYISVTFT